MEQRNKQHGQMPNKTILLCISGWGSRCQIFQPLLNRHPAIAERQRAELDWRDFVAMAPEQRATALYAALCQSSALEGRNCAEQNLEVLLLGWSLGSLLALELACRIQVQSPKWQLRLILLNPTAAMCPSKSNADPLGRDYPTVPAAALKIMQRKLLQPANTVMADFAANCLASGQDKEPFLTEYLAGLEQISIPDLQMGLSYLLQCDLRAQLQQLVLHCPALLLCAAHDAIIPCTQAQALAEQVPASSLHIFDAGHNLLLPAPEAMQLVIADFLTEFCTESTLPNEVPPP